MTNVIPRGTNGDGLLPCPFCGGEVHEVSPEERGDRFWRIECASCGVRMGGTHRVMNREAWNTRAEDTASTEMAQRIQSLESECAKLQDELRKAGNRVGLTAKQVMAIMGRHQPDYCSDTHACFDWQAIADELNAMIGGGECEMVTSGTPSEGNTDKCCTACGAYNIGEYYDGLNHIASPRFCPNCGRSVKR